MKPLFSDYTDSELKSTHDAIRHSLRVAKKTGRLVKLHPIWMTNLKRIEQEVESRKVIY